MVAKRLELKTAWRTRKADLAHSSWRLTGVIQRRITLKISACSSGRLRSVPVPFEVSSAGR